MEDFSAFAPKLVLTQKKNKTKNSKSPSLKSPLRYFSIANISNVPFITNGITFFFQHAPYAVYNNSHIKGLQRSIMNLNAIISSSAKI